MLEPSDVISTSVSLLCCGYDVQIACPGFIGFQVWLPLTASLATEPLSRGCEWATHAFKRIASQLSSIYPNNTTVETLAIDMQLPIRLSLPNLLRETRQLRVRAAEIAGAIALWSSQCRTICCRSVLMLFRDRNYLRLDVASLRDLSAVITKGLPRCQSCFSRRRCCHFHNIFHSVCY